MAQVRYFISSATLPRAQAYPVFTSVLSLRRERDQIFYRENPASDFRFGAGSTLASGDYNKLNNLLDHDECEIVTVEMEVYCGGLWAERWQGEFTWLDLRHNLSECYVSVRPVTQDQYTCFLKAAGEVMNPYDNPLVIALPYSVTEVLEIGGDGLDCITEGPFNAGDPALLLPSPPLDAAWCTAPESFTTFNQLEVPFGDAHYKVTCYQRLKATGSCSGVTPVPPTAALDWTLLSGGCPGVPLFWRCPEGGTIFVTSPLKYGRDFNTILVDLFDVCGLTLVSDFFGIAPDATAPENTAYTFAATNLQKMTLHQKSDVKRPYNSEQARQKQWGFKRSMMLDCLRIMFQVYWKITGTVVRLEHISYFSTTGGLDCTATPMQLETEADVDDKIKDERFFWMDAEGATAYFRGAPIVYDCGSEIVERRVPIISTDLSIINNNDSTDILDEGFVLVATEVVGANRHILRDNRPLAFWELHANLFRWDRYFKDFTLNGSATTALTTRGTRRQPPFSRALCCADTFNPELLVPTTLGSGRIQSAEIDVRNDTIRLELKY